MTHRIALVAVFAMAMATIGLNSSQIYAAGPKADTPKIAYRTTKIDGLDIFLREAGPKNAPAILLLHAYPSSSFMFRNLIPLLMDKYHIVAPDFPSYGQSSAPAADKFKYSYENFADVTSKLTDQLGLTKYAI